MALKYYKLLGFYFISFLILLIPYTPYPFGNFYFLFPRIDLLFIFYFYIYRNKTPLYVFLFIIAVIYDSLNNFLIGSSAISYFLTLLIFRFQKKLFNLNEFNEILLSFIVFAIEFLLINLIIIYLVNNIMADFGILSLNYLITIILYPIFHNSFHYLALLVKIDDSK